MGDPPPPPPPPPQPRRHLAFLDAACAAAATADAPTVGAPGGAAQTGRAVGRERTIYNAGGAIRWSCTTTPATNLPPNMFEPPVFTLFNGAILLETVVRGPARGARWDCWYASHETDQKRSR